MDSNLRWFVHALRDACDYALSDGMIGNQMGHIESIEVTECDIDAEHAPIMLKVTCFGAYSPTEARRVHENQSIVEVMDRVARYLGDRAIGLKDSFDDLR
ncbi:hypothetical protein EBZ80_21535 [bacterium]|nr:hypothetical protein [Betaproteobacteria bacterium]NDE17507.1 hypothetical protein [bacterium]